MPMEMSFLTYNNVHDEFSVETHHKGSRLPPTAMYIPSKSVANSQNLFFKTVFFSLNKLLNFATECNSGPPVIHTLNFIVEIKKTLALGEMIQVKIKLFLKINFTICIIGPDHLLPLSNL